MKESNKSTRRDFLQRSVLFGSLSLISLPLINTSCSDWKGQKVKGFPPQLDKAPDGTRLKAGVVGCGGRGTGAALNFLDAGPNLEISAVADVFKDRIDQFRANLKKERNVDIDDRNCFVGFDAYKQLLETDVDVVILATHAYFRPEHFQACVNAGKHVFLEKPVAVDPVGVRSVIATAKQAKAAGLSVITGTQRRHARDFRDIYNQVQNGAIGKVTSANVRWFSGGGNRTPKPEWNEMEAMIRFAYDWVWLSGDYMVDPNIHSVDIANWYMQKPPIKAEALGGRVRAESGDRYDICAVEFAYDDNRRVTDFCRGIDGCDRGQYFHIQGTEGSTNAHNVIWDLDGNEKYKYAYPTEMKRVWDMMVNAWLQEHIDWVEAIRTGKQLVEAEETAISNMMCIMAREAAYSGQIVTWDQMMKSDMKLGPPELKWGPVNVLKMPVFAGNNA